MRKCFYLQWLRLLWMQWKGEHQRLVFFGLAKRWRTRVRHMCFDHVSQHFVFICFIRIFCRPEFAAAILNAAWSQVPRVFSLSAVSESKRNAMGARPSMRNVMLAAWSQMQQFHAIRRFQLLWHSWVLCFIPRSAVASCKVKSCNVKFQGFILPCYENMLPISGR